MVNPTRLVSLRQILCFYITTDKTMSRRIDNDCTSVQDDRVRWFFTFFVFIIFPVRLITFRPRRGAAADKTKKIVFFKPLFLDFCSPPLSLFHRTRVTQIGGRVLNIITLLQRIRVYYGRSRRKRYTCVINCYVNLRAVPSIRALIILSNI